MLDSLHNRGLDTSVYNDIKTIMLWEGNYRVNLHKDGKIKDSYFVRYSEAEGILYTIPALKEVKHE